MNKYDWDINKIKLIVNDSINFSEVLTKLNIPVRGNNINTLKNILIKNNIDYSHFTGRARKYKTNYKSANNFLKENTVIKASKLKEKLLKENIIEYKCAICGLSQWQNKNIILQLHHIDGNNKNNNLNNLQLLCPNCHSQTENYCGNSNKNKNTTHNKCKLCGKNISKKAVYCSVCAAQLRRKVKRPNYKDLLNDYICLKTFVAIGNKYNVSDNTIKKWFKYYNLPTKLKELKQYICSLTDMPGWWNR